MGAIALMPFVFKEAECLEVTLILNTPDKHEVAGTLKELKEDGTITLIAAYGEETYRKAQYLTATCPEPQEHTLAGQTYLKGEYEKALALYQQVYDNYRLLGWGAASLEGIGKSYTQMANLSAAIESYAKLLWDYPSYAGSRQVKFSLAQACQVKQQLSWAVDLYEQVATESDDELSASALRNVGDIHYGKGDYREALLSYLRVAILYQNFPKAPVAESTFKAADCFEKLAQKEMSPEVVARLKERAKKYYSDVMTRFPQSDFARQASSRYQQLTGGASTEAPPPQEKSSATAGGRG